MRGFPLRATAQTRASGNTVGMPRPYMKSADRRKQIVEATLDLVAKHGVQGATLNRIAREVGVTTAALYGHFANRREILLEAMDAVFEMVMKLHRSAQHPDAVERLREIGTQHTTMVSTAEGFARAFFEFIAAPPDEGLREALGEKELMLVEDLAEIVRDGQVQGTIRADADPRYVAWLFVSRAWTEDVSYLMGIHEHWMGERSARMLSDILDSIRASES